jgi:hypothetical protein
MSVHENRSRRFGFVIEVVEQYVWPYYPLVLSHRKGVQLQNARYKFLAVANCGTKVAERSLTRIMKRCYIYPHSCLQSIMRRFARQSLLY